MSSSLQLHVVHRIPQARILEWVAIPFSRGPSQPRNQTRVSRIAGGFFTSWATREAQEYWSGSPIPSPGDLPNPGLNRGLLHCRWILYQLSYQGSPALPHGFCISVVSWPETSFPHSSNLSPPPQPFSVTCLASVIAWQPPCKADFYVKGEALKWVCQETGSGS